MGRSPCCAKEGLNRGAWTAIEDKILTDYITIHGEGKWRHLPKRAGLKRCGKSCRLRWLNYLRPDIKRGNITDDEEDLIIRLHKLLGNRWSLIAGRLPGRTDNEIKNYWNTNIGKRLQNAKPKSTSSLSSAGQDPNPKVGPNPSSCVVQTKASRCTKVIVSKQVQPLMVSPSSLTSHDNMNNNNNNAICHEKKELSSPLSQLSSSPFMDIEGINNNNNSNNDDDTNNALDFMVDFEMDEGFFSDLVLNMDMSEPNCVENRVIVENSNDDANTMDHKCCHLHLSPTSNDHTTHHLENVSHDSLHGGSEDLQSMSALMEDNEFDWLSTLERS